jgi:hypothetical protein
VDLKGISMIAKALSCRPVGPVRVSCLGEERSRWIVRRPEAACLGSVVVRGGVLLAVDSCGKWRPDVRHMGDWVLELCLENDFVPRAMRGLTR